MNPRKKFWKENEFLEQKWQENEFKKPILTTEWTLDIENSAWK